MLEVANLEVVYNEVILSLRGLSVEVPEGKIVALLGANGAGKTTTARAIGGLLKVHGGKATKGTVTWKGNDVLGAEPSAVVKSGITQVMEGRRIFAELTVDENMMCGGYTIKDKAQREASYQQVMDLFPRLKERRSQVAGYMSGGEQQMLAIGRAMMTSPELLILDEPSLGLAPLLVEQIREIIVNINAQGTSVLLIEQNAMMALSVADYGYVLETGSVVMAGDGKSLLANPEIQEFYLGLHSDDDGETKSYRDLKHYRRKKKWSS